MGSLALSHVEVAAVHIPTAHVSVATGTRKVLVSTPAGAFAALRPNPSLKLTRYGRLCKPGPRQSYYRRVPGLQSLP